MKHKRNKARSFESAANSYNYEVVESESCNPPPPIGVEDMREEDICAWKDEVVVKSEPEAPSAGEELEERPTPRRSRYVRRRAPRANGDQDEAAENRKSDDSVTAHKPGYSVKGKEHNFNEEEPAEGCAFLWCLDCGRLERIKFGNRTLPTYLEGGVGEQKCGIVLILCGLCRRTPARVTVLKNQLESRMKSSSNQLALGAQVFEGSEAIRAARAIAQRGVQVLTDAFGVGYRDVDKIVQELGMDDQIASVDLDEFRKSGGQRCTQSKFYLIT
jgi:hypothetical protein